MTDARRVSYLPLAVVAVLITAACGPTVPTPPPGSLGEHPTYSLSGVVTALTPWGAVPVEDALIEVLDRHVLTLSDRTGRYSFSGLAAGTAAIQVSKWPFETSKQSVDVNRDTILDLQIVQGPFTLSGRVTEDTPTGSVPISGVDVEAVLCPPQPGGAYTLVPATTDADGFYSITGMCNGLTAVFPRRAGYQLAPTTEKPCDGDGAECRWVTIAGDTRFDIRLVRR